MFCKDCGQWIENLIYCNDCRSKRAKALDEKRTASGAKIHDKLDATLDYCRRRGLSYAEYQKLRTLGKLGDK